jgi:hypothetical protein
MTAEGRKHAVADQESGRSQAHTLNVGNLHDIGHLTEATRLAAMAEVQSDSPKSSPAA